MQSCKGCEQLFRGKCKLGFEVEKVEGDYKRPWKCTKKYKKEPKITDSWLNKKLDDLWSKNVRKRGRCEVCGRTENLHAHHIFTRTKHITRWDLQNGVCLCYHHHFNFAHQTPMEFHDWLVELKGAEWVDKLRFKSNQIAKFSMEEKMEMIEKLQEEYNKK